jgi:hypothetical protein
MTFSVVHSMHYDFGIELGANEPSVLQSKRSLSMLTPQKQTDKSFLDTLSLSLNSLQRRSFGIRLGKVTASVQATVCAAVWTPYQPY